MERNELEALSIFAKNNGIMNWPFEDVLNEYKTVKMHHEEPKFDPKTLKPFDKVLVRDSRLVSDSLSSYWRCQIFSFIEEEDKDYPYVCIGESYSFCIPYNDDTKHLVGTKEEAPDFYKYWED